jgi:hypothetical protein
VAVPNCMTQHKLNLQDLVVDVKTLKPIICKKVDVAFSSLTIQWEIIEMKKKESNIQSFLAFEATCSGTFQVINSKLIIFEKVGGV